MAATLALTKGPSPVYGRGVLVLEPTGEGRLHLVVERHIGSGGARIAVEREEGVALVALGLSRGLPVERAEPLPARQVEDHVVDLALHDAILSGDQLQIGK